MSLIVSHTKIGGRQKNYRQSIQSYACKKVTKFLNCIYEGKRKKLAHEKCLDKNLDYTYLKKYKIIIRLLVIVITFL